MTQLHVEGEVRSPQAFGFTELRALADQIEDVSQLIPGRDGSAVRLQAVLDQVGPKETVRYITLESTDGKFFASVPLEAVQEGIIAYRFNDTALPENKGGPYRFFIPNIEECHVGEVDACANVKFLAASASVTRKVGMSDRSVRRRTRNIIKSPATSIWTEFAPAPTGSEKTPLLGGE